MILPVSLLSSTASKLVAGVENLGASANAVSASTSTAGADFTKMLSEAADSIKGAETTAIAGIQGHASTQQVVDAIMNAQTTFQTALAVRDKAVSAYQELSHMAI